MSSSCPSLPSAAVPRALVGPRRTQRHASELVHRCSPYRAVAFDRSVDAASHPTTAIVVMRIVRELSRMARQLGRPYVSSPFSEVLQRAWSFLGTIAEHLHRRSIVPRPPVRVRRSAVPPPATSRPVRLGVFPVNGNPLHWGHLLCALEAMAELRLDQVVFLVQGIDRRKPLAGEATQRDRHRLARQVVGLLEPLAVYSDIGFGNAAVGEDNLFRLLQLNPATSILAHYVVGADHYRRVDEAGCPDTLPRLEQNMDDPAYRFDRRRHEVRVVFVERGHREAEVPTKLVVRFLPETLGSSSTAVREGNVALTPHLVVRYLGRHPDYAASIGFSSAGGGAVGRIHHRSDSTVGPS